MEIFLLLLPLFVVVWLRMSVRCDADSDTDADTNMDIKFVSRLQIYHNVYMLTDIGLVYEAKEYISPVPS